MPQRYITEIFSRIVLHDPAGPWAYFNIIGDIVQNTRLNLSRRECANVPSRESPGFAKTTGWIRCLCVRVCVRVRVRVRVRV